MPNTTPKVFFGDSFLETKIKAPLMLLFQWQYQYYASRNALHTLTNYKYHQNIISASIDDTLLGPLLIFCLQNEYHSEQK